MDSLTLTVFFEGAYWVGIAESRGADEVRIVRHIFGGEPPPGVVLEFVLYGLAPLLVHAGDSDTHVAPPPARPRNPKRAAREAARAIQEQGVSPEAEAALRAERDRVKQERAAEQRQQREVEAAHRRALAVARAKARHRGR